MSLHRIRFAHRSALKIALGPVALGLLAAASACSNDVVTQSSSSGTTTTTTVSTTSAGGGGSGSTGDTTVATTSTGMGGTGGIGMPSDVYPAPHPEAPHVVTFGGPVLTAPKIVPIVFASDNATLKQQIADYTSKIGATDYWAAATSEYGVGPAVGLPQVELSDAPPTTITDDAIQQFLTSKIGDQTLPQPDGQTLYAIFYPKTTTITLQGEKSCQSFGGYHNEFNGPGGPIPYAVVPQCSNFGGLNGIDDITGAGSHEYIEAVTDPFPNNQTAYGQVDDQHLIWEFALGGGETGDMCAQNPGAFTKFPGFDYIVQRTWSNAAAKASHDPCQPIQNGHVYFNAAPVLNDTISIQGAAMKGVKIKEGETKTIDIDLFSDGPTGPFTVQAFDGSQFGQSAGQLDLQLDESQGQNGQVLHLTINVVQASQYKAEAFFLMSDNGQDQNMWVGLVGN